MMVRETLLLVTIGAVLGTLASLAANRYIAAQLFGVTPRDPVAIGVALSVLAHRDAGGWLRARAPGKPHRSGEGAAGGVTPTGRSCMRGADIPMELVATTSSQRCPKCTSSMEQGFVLDQTHGARLVSHWVAGAPLKSFWTGTKVPEDQAHPDRQLPLYIVRLPRALRAAGVRGKVRRRLRLLRAVALEAIEVRIAVGDDAEQRIDEPEQRAVACAQGRERDCMRFE